MIVQRDIPAGFTAAQEVREEIVTLAEDMGLRGDALFNAKLSIEEVLVHAIKKRLSGSAVPGRLLIRAEITGQGVTVSIRDVG